MKLLKLSKAKAQLILSQPFFASIVMRMNFQPSNVETISTDGESFRFNPSWVDSVSVDHIKTVLCKLVLNIANFHHLRMQGRNPQTWNIAATYSIVKHMENGGFYLPPEFDINVATSFGDKSAEEIYELLENEQKQDSIERSTSSDGNTQGDDESRSESKNEEINDDLKMGVVEQSEMNATQQRVHEQDVKTALVQAANAAKMQGSMTGNLQVLVDEVVEPQINWREALSQLMNEKSKNDYSWSRPNKRFAHLGLYLPSLDQPEIGEIVCIMDTSASVSRKEREALTAEMIDIAATFDTEITAVYCDTEVKSVQRIESDTEVHAKGGGGTDFRPPFEYIEESEIEPVCAVYLTDGGCNRFPNEPDYPVLWILTGDWAIRNNYFKPPFGDVIVMDLN